MLRLTATLLLLAAGVAAAADAKNCRLVRVAELSTRNAEYSPVVDGAINGRSVGVMLDTGASRSVIRRPAAVRLGLTIQEATGYRVFGIGGEAKAEAAILEEFRLGEFTRKDWRVLVAGTSDTRTDVAINIGDDFFQNVDVEFDLANNKVRLFQPLDCKGAKLGYWASDGIGEVAMEPGERTEFFVEINGRPVRALLDSGAGTSIVTTLHAERLGFTPQTPGVATGGCAGGFGNKLTDSWIATFQSFSIGNETIRNPAIRFGDVWQHATQTETGSRLSRSIDVMPGMLLGADFLRSHRVLIANSQRKVYFSHSGGTVFPTAPAKSCPEK